MITCGIYAIVNKVTGEWYGGQSIDIPRRIRQHFRQLARRASPFRPLQEAYDKSGPGAFAGIALEACAPERLDEREQAYLDAGFAMGVVYNNATRAGWPPKGHRWSEDSRAAFGDVRREIVADPDVHQRLVDGLAKRSPEWREGVVARGRSWRSNPEFVARHDEGIRRRSENADWRTHMAAQNKAFADDPKWREAVKAGHATDQARRNHGEATRRTWAARRADPEAYAAWCKKISDGKRRRRTQ